MTDVLSEVQDHVAQITLNRIQKHNAFDEMILAELQTLLDEAIQNPQVHVILLKANGPHFCSGADISWMQRMAEFSEEENLADALILARLMNRLYECPKPTIAMVQGSAMGGGVGLVAACDIAIAADDARFCFSEVKLGLIPAVISPYVIKAIGERMALNLFMSAEVVNAQRALALNLVQQCVPKETLATHTMAYAQHIAQWPAEAVYAAKSLVRQVANAPIDSALQALTASLIAKQRVSAEGQRGLKAFLHKDNQP